MTYAEHADLSLKLALAIGWDERRVAVKGNTTVWCMERRDGVGHGWRRFDYRDPLVIWPIAERYKCFPFAIRGGGWWAWVPGHNGFSGKRGDTAAEAVARAVVGGRG